MQKQILLTGAIIALSGFAGYHYLTSSKAPEIPEVATGSALVQVALPEELSKTAQKGKLAFEAECALCHGVNAAGNSEAAPPLVHKIYEPGHHGDESFQRAAALGVQAHHWRFGNMPPVEGLSRGEVVTIIAYIRELQRANGIF